jgi:hypothetical protein
MLKDFLRIIANNNGHFNPGGEADPAPAAADPAPTGGEPTGEPTYNYPESLDKEYHGNPTLMKYVNKETGEFDQGQIMKALIHANKAIGAEKMLVPNKNFTPDQWKETFTKLGLPESVDKYSIENNVPEGTAVNEEFLNSFKKTAHEAGILPSQAQKLLDFYNTSVTEQNQMAQALADKATQEAVTNLKSEWGDAFQGKIQAASKALEQFATPEQVKELAQSGVLDSPLLTRVFAKIAESFNEDTFDSEATANFGMTPQELEDKIASFYEDGHPYMNRDHPQNAFYKEEYMRLINLRMKFKQQAQSATF